jgi:optic atrophy protein 1
MLFWRLNHVLQSSGTMLRVEAAEYRKELEREVRGVLEDIGIDAQAKVELFDSPQVRLAEEIEVIRLIQSKLEAFIRAIESERKV